MKARLHDVRHHLGMGGRFLSSTLDQPACRGTGTSKGTVSDVTASKEDLAPSSSHVSESWNWFRSIGSPKLWLAPMVDYSDTAFRLLARRCGAQICHTQMLDPQSVVEDASYRLKHIGGDLGPLVCQLGGRDPSLLAKAAQALLEEDDARIIRGICLNMGCPQRCAKRGGYGAFLMEDAEQAQLCIKAIATSIKEFNRDRPTTCGVLCKIRCFEDVEETIRYARLMQNAGAFAITVHGRTRSQGGGRFTGQWAANWSWIQEVRKAVAIPVISNGDILNATSIEECLRSTGAHGVMTGIAALRDPLIFRDFCTGERQGVVSHPSTRSPSSPSTAASMPRSLQQSDTIEAVVHADDAGKRLLPYAAKSFPEILGTGGRTKKALKLGIVQRRIGSNVVIATASMILQEGDTLIIQNPQQVAKELDEQELLQYCSETQIVHAEEAPASAYAVVLKPVGVRCRDLPYTSGNFLCLERALPLLLRNLTSVHLDHAPRLLTSLRRSEHGLVLVSLAGKEQNEEELQFIERRFRVLLTGRLDLATAQSILGSVCESQRATKKGAICSLVDATSSPDDSTTVTTLDVWLNWTQDIADVLNAFSDAGIPPIGARREQAVGKGCFVACLELRSQGGKFGDLATSVEEPEKFAMLRASIGRRGTKNATNESYVIPASLTKPDAMVRPPANCMEAALQYCELAVLLRTERKQVHLHLIGKLSMLNQAELKQRHATLYETIRLLADDSRACSEEDELIQEVISGLTQVCNNPQGQ